MRRNEAASDRQKDPDLRATAAFSQRQPPSSVCVAAWRLCCPQGGARPTFNRRMLPWPGDPEPWTGDESE